MVLPFLLLPLGLVILGGAWWYRRRRLAIVNTPAGPAVVPVTDPAVYPYPYYYDYPVGYSTIYPYYRPWGYSYGYGPHPFRDHPPHPFDIHPHSPPGPMPPGSNSIGGGAQAPGAQDHTPPDDAAKAMVIYWARGGKWRY